jgi:RHS repeat-associated protein
VQFANSAAGTNGGNPHNTVNEIDNDNNDANTPSVATITASTGTNWADPTYDKAGNMRGLPYIGDFTSNVTLAYDAWNRLVNVAGGPTTLLSNEYDGLGRVVMKGNQDPANVDVYYNDQWQILEERMDGDSDPKNQYAWHPYYIDALAIRWYDANVNGEFDEESDEGVYYALHDANYNVTAMADTNGGVKERYAYSPYGEVTFLNASFGAGGNAIEQTHLYTGRERDATTGLQLNRHRFYAAHLGRWVQRDPIGYEGGQWNLYEYVGGSPVGAIGPSGLGNLHFPFNSRVCNSCESKSIWVFPGSTGQGEWLASGKCTSWWYDHGDFFKNDGEWYKVPGGCLATVGCNDCSKRCGWSDPNDTCATWCNTIPKPQGAKEPPPQPKPAR